MIAVAVIVAAGSGERFGDSAKVLVPLLGRPLLAWTLDAFSQSTYTTDIVLVVGPHTQAQITDLVSNHTWPKIHAIVPGGETRQQSMANGVAAVPKRTDIVLVHDAARPLVKPAQIDACIQMAETYGGAVLAAPVTDTVKRVANREIVETIDRSTLWGAQTPQAFHIELMRPMATLATSGQRSMTDEASLAELLGYPVHIVPGDNTNLKITHLHDLIMAEAILRARKEQLS